MKSHKPYYKKTDDKLNISDNNQQINRDFKDEMNKNNQQ